MNNSAISTISLQNYTLLLLVKGSGTVEVDFRNYSLSEGKALFLAPGQYVKRLDGDLQMVCHAFEGDPLEQVVNSRYLFKHLVSLGYVDVSKPKRFHLPELKMLQIAGDSEGLLKLAVSDWLRLNPFQATRPEIDLLFDLKDFIDQHYHEQPDLQQVAKGLSHQGQYLNRLTRTKLAATVNRLLHQKLVKEAQRQIAFTDRSTKELAYDLGFQYPTYFNRFFKKHIGKTPGEFRETFGADLSNAFRQNLSQLLDAHFSEQRFMSFYADKLHLSVKALSTKVRDTYGTNFQNLLNQRLLSFGKELLIAGENVTETAYQLGFKEPNHFSTFFKTQTGISPASYSVH